MRVVSMTSVLASLQPVRRAAFVRAYVRIYIYTSLWLYTNIELLYVYGMHACRASSGYMTLHDITFPYLAVDYIAFTFRYIRLHCITFTLLGVADLSPRMFENTVQLPMTEGRCH